MKNFIILIFTIISLNLSAQGALCLYVNSAGEVVCSIYSNSGGPSESNCRAEARASNPACGLNMGAINIAAGSCASQIFISPSRCLDNVSPYNITGSVTQAACESAGDRWCPSTYYGFFVGNSGCQAAICAAAQIALPVELINFNGEIEGSDNIITWTTASEHNSDYFILENSTDGFIWNSIAIIPGAGNSTEIKGYRVIHMSPTITLNYYRLHQIDIDGVLTSYNSISIDNRDEKRSIIRIINIMGQEVNMEYSGMKIMQYTDGTIEKTY